MCPVLASGLGCSLSRRSEPTHLGEVTVAQGAEQRPPEPAPPPRRVAADHVLGLPALQRPCPWDVGGDRAHRQSPSEDVAGLVLRARGAAHSPQAVEVIVRLHRLVKGKKAQSPYQRIEGKYPVMN